MTKVFLSVKAISSIMEHNFQPSLYLKRLGDTENVSSWNSKGLSTEKLATHTTTDNSLCPSINWYGISNFCL